MTFKVTGGPSMKPPNDVCKRCKKPNPTSTFSLCKSCRDYKSNQKRVKGQKRTSDSSEVVLVPSTDCQPKMPPSLSPDEIYERELEVALAALFRAWHMTISHQPITELSLFLEDRISLISKILKASSTNQTIHPHHVLTPPNPIHLDEALPPPPVMYNDPRKMSSSDSSDPPKPRKRRWDVRADECMDVNAAELPQDSPIPSRPQRKTRWDC